MREEASKEDSMATRIRRTDDPKPNDRENDRDQRDEERARVHEAYARLGRMGGEKGGQIRREQMARGEIFTRDTRTHPTDPPTDERRETW
jgi:hypothetical protein